MRQLADRLRIPASKLNRIESGHLSPGASVIERLMQQLELDNIEELFVRACR